jgi:serine/threonine protein kinase
LNHQNNVLINNEGHAQITDFGLTAFADATQGQSSLRDSYGSLNWMAPELHMPEKFGLQNLQRTEASDVYALACLYWEVGLQNFCGSACLTTMIAICWGISISGGVPGLDHTQCRRAREAACTSIW